MLGVGRSISAVARRRLVRQRISGPLARSSQTNSRLEEHARVSTRLNVCSIGVYGDKYVFHGVNSLWRNDRQENSQFSTRTWNTIGESHDNTIPNQRSELIKNLGMKSHRYFETVSDSQNQNSPFRNLAQQTLYRGAIPSVDTRFILDPFQSSLGFSQLDARLYHSCVGSKRSFSSSSNQQPSQYKTSARIPTPNTAPASSMSPVASFNPQAILRSMTDTTLSISKTILQFLLRLPGNVFFYLTHGNERRAKIQEIKDIARKEFNHYWTGTKLLMADARTARELLGRTLQGSTLTRRERKQLLRTVSDLFRVVPFSMFIIIPVGELLLPFALRIFPNMLPSTFQDSLKAEENMKRELQSRIAMAHFFQETLETLAKEQKKIAAKRNVESPDNEIANKQEESAASMLEFLDQAREGVMMPPDVIVQYATYFQDDLTLDNMPRMQLVNMCRYMQLQPYGSDAFLRFQLRHKIRTLKEDDQRIMWEGINSLTKMELREACQERGMRSTGMSKEAYKRSLQQWIDLSVDKSVPISLLIMSRIFFLQEETSPAPGEQEAKNVASLADAISGMDKEVLNEVILEVATSEEKKSDPDIQKIKLEVLTQQNEMIREERAAQEKKKKESEKAEAVKESEKAETAPSEEATTEFETDANTKEIPTTDKVTLSLEIDEISTKEEKNIDVEKANAEEESKEEEKEHDLSTAEMDAISQLLTADPVSKERELLNQIKTAMKESDETSGDPSEESEEQARPQTTIEEQITASAESTIVDRDEKQASATIAEIEKAAAEEATKSTVFSTESEIPRDNVSEAKEEATEVEEEPPEDPIIARLKKRVESMVDKIENQLSDVEIKIGDKLHMLDKDMDGVLSREEMAECLHLVLKREITLEEAFEIASSMDENGDDEITVQELTNWIHTNKLMKLASEGRDADMDRIMESHTAESSDSDSTDSPVTEVKSEPGKVSQTQK